MRFSLVCILLFSTSWLLKAQDCNLTDLFVLPVCDGTSSVNLMVTFYGSDKYSFTDGTNTYNDLDQGIHVFEGLMPDQSYSVTLTDMENSSCQITRQVSTPSCSFKCHSNPGLLMSNSGTNVCEGGRISIDSNGFTLSSRQTLFYLFHTAGENLTSEDFPLDPSQIIHFGNFLDNTDTLSGKIWASAIVAQTGFGGLPEASDPCLQVSNTLEINLLEPIIINHTANCDEGEGSYTFDLTINGGLPQVNANEQYTLNSSVYSGLLSSEQNLTVGPIPNGTSYNLYVTDLNFCASQTSIYMVDCTRVLPIELIEFDGNAMQQGNLLKWVTASEIENDFFTVYRSVDGIDFEKIHIEPGNKTSNTINEYTFLDRDVNNALVYYKLTQTDFDGTENKQKVIVVDRSEYNTNIITNFYPTLVTNEIQFTLVVDNYENLETNIINLQGKIIKKIDLNYVYDAHNYRISVDDLPSGIYYVSFSSDNFLESKLFLKK